MAGAIVVSALVACHRQPEPTYEYGETVTYTSTAGDPAPQDPSPTVRAPVSSAAPPPRNTLPAAAEPAPSGDTVVERDGEWTTTVDTEPSSASAPAAEEAPAPPATAAPDPPAPETIPRERWYKAKPW